MYTVKQLSDLAGVSVRTLHYYDEIGLLKPAAVGANGYRYYREADLLRLQQILFYREIDLGLNQIEVLGGLGQTYRDDPDFRAFFTAIQPDLPDFFAEAIAIYVDRLETEWLRHELGTLAQ